MRIPEPLRLPVAQVDSGCQRCGAATNECFSSVLKHGCFLSVCCGHLLFLYLPRISVVVDLVISLLAFLALGKNPHPDHPNFEMQNAVGDVLVLNVARCIFLWVCFAYRYQREASNTWLKRAWAVAGVCSLFIVIKIILLPWTPFLLWFSLIAPSVEVGMFGIVRYYEAKTSINTDVELTKDGFMQPNRLYQPLRTSFSELETPGAAGPNHSARDGWAKVNTDEEETRSPSGSPKKAPASPMTPLATPKLRTMEPRDLLTCSASRFDTIDGVAIHYALDRGNGGPDAPALVLLHGFGGGVFSWRRSIKDMREFTSDILSFDRPGFGLSGRPKSAQFPDENPYSVEFSVRLLEKLMEKHNIDKAIVIAHSSGALVAYHMALSHPEMVAGLILVSPTLHGMPKFVRSVLQTSLARHVIVNLIRSEISQFTLRRAWHDPESIPSQVFANYRAPLSMPNWEESLVEMTKVKPPANTLDQLKDIRCRVVVLHGSGDKIVSHRDAEEVCRAFSPESEATLQKILSCGHFPFEERPSNFSLYVRHFVKGSHAVNLGDIGGPSSSRGRSSRSSPRGNQYSPAPPENGHSARGHSVDTEVDLERGPELGEEVALTGLR